MATYNGTLFQDFIRRPLPLWTHTRPEYAIHASADAEVSRSLIIGLVIPRQKKLAHIKTLAEIAKLLSKADVRQRLLSCNTAEMAVEVLAEMQGTSR